MNVTDCVFVPLGTNVPMRSPSVISDHVYVGTPPFVTDGIVHVYELTSHRGAVGAVIVKLGSGSIVIV